MRLIDADSFLGFMTALEEAGAEHISFDDLKKFISEQRTAYDVDNIVKRLEDMKYVMMGNYGVRREVVNFNDLVKLLKSGGVGNSD